MAQEPWDRFLSSRFNIHTMMLMILTCSVGRVFFFFPFFWFPSRTSTRTQLFDSPNEEEEEEEEEGMGGDRV